MIPYLSILYSEPDPDTYEGVSLRMVDEPEVFNTGNPTVDYWTAFYVIMRRFNAVGPEASIDPSDVPVLGSSSIDHFAMDGGVLNTEEPSEDEITTAVAAAKAHLGES